MTVKTKVQSSKLTVINPNDEHNFIESRKVELKGLLDRGNFELWMKAQYQKGNVFSDQNGSMH